MKNTRKYIFMGLMIALEIVLTRFIQIPVTLLPGFEDKVHLGFLPVALAGAMFGAACGGSVAALGDFIRAIIFPQGGAINPLFTINAGIRGIVYGIFLKKMTIARIILANTIILVLNIFLMALIISFSYGNPYKTVIITRIPTSITNFIIQSAVLCLAGKPIVRKLDYVRK